MDTQHESTNGHAPHSNGGVKKQNHVDSDRDCAVDLRFGYGKYRPKWMQVFNNPKFLCVLLSAFTFIQSKSVAYIPFICLFISANISGLWHVTDEIFHM